MIWVKNSGNITAECAAAAKYILQNYLSRVSRPTPFWKSYISDATQLRNVWHRVTSNMAARTRLGAPPELRHFGDSPSTPVTCVGRRLLLRKSRWREPGPASESTGRSVTKLVGMLYASTIAFDVTLVAGE